MHSSRTGVFLLASVAAITVACADTTGTSGAVPTTVSLSAATPPLFEVVGVSGTGEATGDPSGLVSVDQIDSLMVSIERVEVLPSDSEVADTTGWIELPVVAPASLDLFALPTTEEGAVTIAAGDLVPGDYGSVRLFIGSAQIWFNAEVTAPGHGGTFAADEPYDVTIPSASHSGIKTDAGFTVPEEGGDIALTFDADATVQHVNLTGNGKIMMPPVIKVRGTLAGG